MSESKFFKTNKPEAIQAVEDYLQQSADLQKSAGDFAEAFCARPVFNYSATQLDFAGIAFPNQSQVNFDVWTEPSEDWCSEPRSKARSSDSSSELEAVKEKYSRLWSMHFSNGSFVEKEKIYTALGTNSESASIAGFGFFIHEGFLYVHTDLEKLDAEEIQEIELNLALSAYNTDNEM